MVKSSGRVRLTDRFVDAIQPPPGSTAVDYADAAAPGLALRVTPHGVKSWSFRFRTAAGKSTRKTLGPYLPASPHEHVTLATARELAGDLRKKLRAGVDISAPPAAPLDSRKFSAVVDRWQRRQTRLGLRSVGETRRILDLHVIPALGDRQVEAIRRRDVIEVLEELRDEKGLGPQVNRVQRAISGVLGYAVDADLIEANPIAGLKPQVAEGSRGRVLDVPELSTVWRACAGVSPTAGAAARLLILTGQRREEATGMSWPELDYDHKTKNWTAGGMWTIPAARSKSKREHIVPLSPAVREIIEAQPRGAAGDFVFSASLGRTSFAGWRRAAPALSKAAALATPWTIHDIRRSVATGLGEVLNIDEGVVGRVLGHSPRSRMGVTARYELSQRLAHVRGALDAWATLILERVAADEGANVVPFPTAIA
ncbi:tyrosine-type recombinase/integrase [Reyranella sp.]|uniref:tyrosine-type recombinase/integrase n=1 Tax=Reyranella sp. TaxID=1929291 RepID=UPI003D100697